MTTNKHALTANHWGVGVAHIENGKLVKISPHPDDPASSQLNDNVASSLNGSARVLHPSIRRSWLYNGPGRGDKDRGQDEFVRVSWEKANKLIAAEINRVRETYSNESIFAGSYGWASAGRFHHAQSQLKRFLNTQGGSVSSEGNYSYNAALVLMPHIMESFRVQVSKATRWSVIAEHTKLLVMFGGIAERNTQISDGGIARHRMASGFKKCADAGVKCINISPVRTDASKTLKSEWLPPKPGSDTAIMMGLAHTLLTENLHDKAFLEKYTTGFEHIRAYLLGEKDGIAKDANWASIQSGLDANRIKERARQMAASRTMISVAAGVQRTDYGEQPLWMAVTLASMLGQIGLPGGGYVIGYGVNGNIGNMERLFRWGTVPQGQNPIKTAVPVALIADLSLHPGKSYKYNGRLHKFPDTKLVWWAGGNPFHHHQDLNRLHRAFQKPDTIIVNEVNWTATAKRADIVLPVAAAHERLDFGGGKSDNALVPMPMVITPPGEAKTEYEIYSGIAEQLGNQDEFTEGRSISDWLKHIWRITQNNGKEHNIDLPDWDEFIQGDVITVPDPSPNQVFMADFRDDPIKNRLPTPSGKIELYSETIASFNLKSCPGHPTWFEPRDVAAGRGETYPLYLLSGQPKTRLHSQLDNGDYSKSHKIKDREPVLINPIDAKKRGIEHGDIVELFNDRGRCLAGAKVTDEIAQGCIFLWTGAWLDQDFNAPQNRDNHGNPNVLTHDERTSSLSQSPASHSALVDVQLYTEKLPKIRAHEPPSFRK
ncbi:MAG: molybdopterin-dependent oxidoreductase [Rhizobiaceae bacterium]|nr:molybdopterin-dependent oxidoreductase [Rhizobiaceae bacterium]